ncbi:copper resistance protein B [Solilutibacter oculi]|nr:copper resistance protein B [Lysobacter oculi]
MRLLPFPIACLLTASPAFAQHAGHDHGQHPPMAMPAPTPSEAPAKTALPDFIPPPTPEEITAAFPDLHGMDMSSHMREDPWLTHLRVDRLERSLGSDAATGWEMHAWTGRTRDRLEFKTEGERDAHGSHGHMELAWSHATGPWWNRTLGVRRDFGGGLQRDWLGVGVHGHAPYKFDVEAAAFVGSSGRAMLEGHAGYDVLLTNRLVLRPQAGLTVHARDDIGMGIGRGVSEFESGLRLRYEIRREFAPYIGWRYQRAFGRTADIREAHGDAPSGHEWVAGVRFWF